jgi:hypothetical protein
MSAPAVPSRETSGGLARAPPARATGVTPERLAGLAAGTWC